MAGMKLKSILKQTYSIIFFFFSTSEKAGVPLFGISIFAVAPLVETRTGIHPLSLIPVNTLIAAISLSSKAKLKSTEELPVGALREMAERVRQPELMSVISAIVQADEMGVSIGNLLKIQSDQLRMKRFTMAEKLANETPVKILFPVVVFIFPAVLLLLLAPILMQSFSILL